MGGLSQRPSERVAETDPAPIEKRRASAARDQQYRYSDPNRSSSNDTSRDYRSATQDQTTDVYASEISPATNAPPLGAEPIEVLPGDTLYGVSNRYSVNMRAMIETNQLEPPFALSPGQTLYLPPPNTHIVEPGETLYSISRRYNVDTRSLALMNGLPKPWTIAPGDQVVLPALARDSGRLGEASPPPLPEQQNFVSIPKSAPIALQKNDSKPVTTPGVASSAGFQWPVLGPVVKPFGRGAGGQRNDGVNIEGGVGAPISAAADGDVVYAGDELGAFGNLLLIRHKDGWITAYAHAQKLLVAEGETVRRGQAIAEIGASGS
ncbi:MAG: M23 family metallopeptidase, partial [Pseudomonadota bacterium]